MTDKNEVMKIDQIIDGVRFRASIEEWDIQALIAQRAEKIALSRGIDYHAIAIHMDICAVHCNGHRLRLLDMLVARDDSLWNDICGIEADIDRTTGKLCGAFFPFFSEIEEAPK
jgi:Family of unknown function (DUF6874)